MSQLVVYKHGGIYKHGGNGWFTEFISEEEELWTEGVFRYSSECVWIVPGTVKVD